METFDYVIVGAGSAGSVLASRLSEDGNVTVCVLEAGPWDWHPFIHIPAGFMYTLVNPRVNWLYTSEASEWTGGRRIAAPRPRPRRGGRGAARAATPAPPASGQPCGSETLHPKVTAAPEG